MPKLFLTAVAACVLWTSSAAAQAPLEANPLAPAPVAAPPAQVFPQRPPLRTPPYSSSWSRRESAREAVVRRAAWKAAQRTQRMEAMKWYGHSPLRPAVSTMPWMGSTSTWIGGAIIYHHYPGMMFPRTAGR